MAVGSARAFAKINTGLLVGNRREDGFHPIASVFRLIDLCDEIEVLCQESDSFSVVVAGLEDVCPAGESTIEKAARLWHRETGVNARVFVSVTKRIPTQAGLGGGSSDAACFLNLMQEVSGVSLSVEALKRIALETGSDVPFFMSGASCAVVTGRGENVFPMKPTPALKGFLVVPDAQKVSTAKAYAVLDERGSVSKLPTVEEVKEGALGFENDFELVNRRPDVEAAPGERLFLTGSGSVWVLLSDRKIEQIKCKGCSLVPFETLL